MMELALTAAGVEVVTATTDHAGPGRRLRADEMLASVNGANRIYARKVMDFYKVAPALVPWLWRNVRRFDVLHVHALFSFTSIAAALIAWMRGAPYVIRPLGTLNSYGITRRRPWLKKMSFAVLEAPILRRASAIHFTSQAEWDAASSLGVPLRGVVAPLGVDIEPEGDGESLRQSYSRLQGRGVALFLSRVDPKKNIESLIEGFASSSRLRADAALIVAGDGESDYVSSLKELARSRGVAHHLIWLGHVEGDRKAAAFAAADVFVLPSYSENFGIAAAEALLAGLPCILGRGVAIAAEIERAGAGIAVEPNGGAVAAALSELLGDEERRRQMGVRARAFAQQEYSTQRMAQRLIALYQDVLRCRLQPAP